MFQRELSYVFDRLGLGKMEKKSLIKKKKIKLQSKEYIDHPLAPSSTIKSLLLLIEKKKYQQVIETASVLLKSHPNDIRLLKIMAASYDFLGSTARAEKVLIKATRLYPADFSGHFAIAQFFHKNGRLTEAIKSYKKALKLRGGFPLLYNNLSLALQKIGKNSEAIKFLLSALNQDPQNTATMQALGKIFLETHQYENAQKMFNRLSLFDKTDYEAVFCEGFAMFKQGKLYSANRKFNRLLKTNFKKSDVFNCLGLINKDLGNFQLCADYFSKALIENPNNFNAAANLAKQPAAFISETGLSLLTKFLEKKDKAKAPEERWLFLEANVKHAIGSFEKATQTYLKANSIKFNECKASLQEDYIVRSKILTDLSALQLNLPSQVEGEMKKVFLLGPSRSGKTTLEYFLAKHLNGYRCFEPIKNASLNSKNFFEKESSKNAERNAITKKLFYIDERVDLDDYHFICSTNPHSLKWLSQIVAFVPNSYFIIIERDKEKIATDIFRNEFIHGNAYAYKTEEIYEYLEWYYQCCKVLEEKLSRVTTRVVIDELPTQPMKVINKINAKFDLCQQVKDLDENAREKLERF